MNQPAYVDSALALRRTHPEAPARDLLDLVMPGRMPIADSPSAPWLEPGHPFGELVCKAFDTVMTIEEWRVMSGPRQEHREGMLDVWRRFVVARFLDRYSGLELPPEPPPEVRRQIRSL